MRKEFVGYTLSQLKGMLRDSFVNELGTFTTSLDLKYTTTQKKSWGDCYDYLKTEFKHITKYDESILLFEYCLPFTNYRRPDVIMLFEGTVLVLEFKRKDNSLTQDVDQLRGYLNFLRRYHDETQKMGLDVKGALILTTSTDNLVQHCDGYTLVKGNGLIHLIEELLLRRCLDEGRSLTWANSAYEPSKNILKATYSMFKSNDLSMIKNISEHELRNILKVLYEITVEKHNKKRLVFLTGVPGAGKTLALLHTLYKLNQEGFNAVFLTGNGPLEKVLSYLLTNASTGAEGDSLIKGVLAYKKAYFDRYNKQPFTNAKFLATIFFDEAQRAWDEEKMGALYGMSEPELILKVQDAAFDKRGYTNVVASIGFGQSIYKGEENEFETWVRVIEKEEYSDWEIYAPATLKNKLSHLSNVTYVDDLHLDTTIRSNFINTTPFIEAVLAADINVAREENRKLREQGYFIHIVDNLESAKSYLEAHARETGDKFYGLISSSNIRLMDHQTYLGNARMMQQTDSQEVIGKWYFKDSSKLDAVATEFVCQGLELNIPLLYFGGDFLMENGNWVVRPTKKYEDKDRTVRNIYRVLLSRGRLGLFIYIPKNTRFEETKNFFQSIGVNMS
ncbi:DUF2075 domain-containing protein [Paenibacillus sp. CGMCC 1.16610]|uniref:DUF2075 domain-containing protein n=1 Tax=Paenibacillus anseongense TaxID=2682845 RepID=A0ABW9U016_9BACL|nr:MULTISPECIES: DNA/RNA helicase domain-containing protein [Paenibacillus]MBA2937024.1 DUF2075 domain-containing protein [Paenibacillus sp. CGMCC 1.16610]MVQ33348.1 DUF2075 domain-containing protein [Paenibacillus anseongense]